MLVLPPSLMTLAGSFATTDLGAAWTIAAAHTDISANGVLSATAATDTTFLQFEPTSSSILALLDNTSVQQDILANIHNVDDALALASDTTSKVIEILASAKNTDFEPIFDNPIALISTIALVTGTDMLPSVPFQPLAMSLGAKYGACAFPVCVVGQTLAAVLAFQSSRKVSDSKEVQKVLESLGEEGQNGLHKFKTESLLGGGDSDESETSFEKERNVFFALVGLRQLPFFPFNYLLGAATDVSLRPFVLATIVTCMFSNAVSILMGMGGAELFMNNAMR